MSYEDIIHLPHHTSSRHPRMSREDRAAQFAPFAALTGHEDAIREEARLTDAEICLTDERVARLNAQMAYLADHLDDRPTVVVTYFCPDWHKSGGAYRTVNGVVHAVDGIEETLTLSGGLTIPMAAIRSIEGGGLPDD